jgi:quercetin dioxygenase-like cupin family protein
VKIRNFRDVEPNNEVPGVALRTVISAQDGAPRFAMRVFEVEPGGSTPFHTHAWEHEVFILDGQAKVRSADGERALKPNDAVFVAGQEEHCFVNTGPQVLRFICCIPHPETIPAEQASASAGPAAGCEG